MFVILVYDVNVKRVSKVLKTCRKYLHWVQNSVFEGKTTEARLARLMSELKKIINREEDSIIIYCFETTRYSNREIIGLKKGGEDYFI
ncbi:CRISPR-associated endonuclease Cas2 [Thermodesulforhabdus norvegica]|uniref:CRISPR-associated endoribonuclease Cas2 n=1 Tax=Thermodesulforhabdus norvegica TaxID=39841 RepID=A0A1I4TMM8_9BACT|nr:CRISPR-associated endonuclease Cas2 [Thermodesulforhabdus norvegica]SFM78002.1 CRISPR-associated protein, Cas2 family [Thermodesulforhabdus norvegica]